LTKGFPTAAAALETIVEHLHKAFTKGVLHFLSFR